MLQLTDKKNRLVLYFFLLIVLSTTSIKFLEKNTYFSKKNNFTIEGLTGAENAKILEELNDLFYRNIFTLNKEEINKIIYKYNIIEQFTVKKIYPKGLNIKIKPTKFIAKLSSGNQLLIGANGKLISRNINNESLPFMFGEFNTKKFLNFKKSVENSKFKFSEFKTLYYFPSNRWDVLTNKNILIKLPQKNLLQSLNLAYRIINNKQLINENIVDLRITNHLIVK
jgi:cell division protein FtsQ